MWMIERLCGKRGLVAPSVWATFNDPRATPAVLTFLRDTREGRMISLTPREDDGEGREEEREGEES
jgi:hypothetical protein